MQGETAKLPTLSAGVVCFDDARAFMQAYHTTLCRGALAILSSETLAPLLPFDVCLKIANSKLAVTVSVQVLSCRDKVFLLQLVDGQEAYQVQLSAFARAVEARQAFVEQTQEAIPASQAGSDVAGTATKAPQTEQTATSIHVETTVPAPVPKCAATDKTTDDESTLSPESAYPESASPKMGSIEATATATPVDGHTEKGVAATPFLHGNTITFVDAAMAQHQLDEIAKTGGMMVEIKGDAPSFGSISVRFCIAGMHMSEDFGAEVVFAQQAQVALVFVAAAKVKTAIQNMLQEPADAAGNKASVHQTERLAVSLRVVRPPDSPPALLSLDLFHPPDPRASLQLNLLELVAAAGRLRATGCLYLSTKDLRLSFPLKGGALLLSNDERDNLIEMSMQQGLEAEVVTALPERISAEARPRDPRAIVVDMLRRHLREHRAEQLEVALAARLQLYPMARPQVSPALLGLRLEAKEARFLDVIVDGTRSLAELPQVSGMLRPATFRLFYLLLIYRLIELHEEAKLVLTEDPKKLFRQECERLLAANMFDLLAVHWSEHPNAIRSRYERRKLRFAPGGAGAKFDADLARKVYNAMDKAYETLSSREGRCQERGTLGQVDLRGAAGILAKHAELASMRDDAKTVKESLEMAMELHPSREYQAMMMRLLRN